jgi:hypothetical protein
MLRKNAWRCAALTIAALAPAGLAGASEPPSSKVAYWHDQLCPRDLTPTVTGPCFGYYPTRWRVMPPCDPPADLVLPPTGTPVGQAGKPAPNKSAAKKPGTGPSPYGGPARTGGDQSPKGEWTTARPASVQVLMPQPAAEIKLPSAVPEKRERSLYPPPE